VTAKVAGLDDPLDGRGISISMTVAAEAASEPRRFTMENHVLTTTMPAP
jgi:hypothetical protein